MGSTSRRLLILSPYRSFRVITAASAKTMEMIEADDHQLFPPFSSKWWIGTIRRRACQ